MDETLDVSYDELYKKALRKGGLEWSKEQINRGIEKGSVTSTETPLVGTINIAR